MKREDSLFDLQFLKRFSTRPVCLLLGGSFVGGIIAGTLAVKAFDLLQDQAVLPLFFSGVPVRGSSFFPCFSTILLNILVGLISLFLLGVTAFGAFGIPVFLFFKGASASVGVLSFLVDGGLPELGRSAVCFTPAATAASLLLLLFATRALIFSNSLARAGFSQHQKALDFQLYFKDFMYFLCFSVAVSVTGGILATLYGLF